MNKQDVEIRPLTAADSRYFTDGVELLNRTQGRGMFAESYLADRTADPNCLVFAGFYDGQIVAIGVTQLLQNLDYYLPFDPKIKTKLANKTVGSFSTLCVREDLQGQGIGQRISHERLKWLESRKCDAVLGVSWISGQKHTSDRVFEKLGFRLVKKVEDFYSVSPFHVNFDCPACAKIPCQCPVALYMREY